MASTPLRCLKMTVSYDGTAYSGWQVQSNNVTVQSTLEDALKTITGESIRIVASGRTDAGVHALGQVVSFSTGTHLENAVLVRALNATTPRDIRVRSIEDVADGFHAIRDAVSKRYRYVLQDGPVQDLFSRAYCWYVPQLLDAEKMQAASQMLLGRHDFSSFEAAGSPRASSVRNIIDISVRRRAGDWFGDVENSYIWIEVEADGFLYNMVRNIVGTMVVIGRGDMSVGWMSDVLRHADRRQAGATAPPQGLFLVEVHYPCELPTSSRE